MKSTESREEVGAVVDKAEAKTPVLTMPITPSIPTSMAIKRARTSTPSNGSLFHTRAKFFRTSFYLRDNSLTIMRALSFLQVS